MMPVEQFAAASNQQPLGGAWPVGIDDLTAARAEVLFATDLSQWASPAEAEVAAAIKHALRVFGGTRGCVGEVAAAYGEDPETAVSRMRWALQVVQLTYAHGKELRLACLLPTERTTSDVSCHLPSLMSSATAGDANPAPPLHRGPAKTGPLVLD